MPGALSRTYSLNILQSDTKGHAVRQGGRCMSNVLIPVLDLKRQPEWLLRELELVIGRVLRSGRYISGPETERFESEFAEYSGVRNCVAVGSGTAALNLTLRALGVGQGDEVITAAFTISPTLDAIKDLGATPVLVDVTESSYTLDPSRLEEKITPMSKAILPVHIYGHPAAMEEIELVANRYGLPVVADACESHGALYRDRPASSLGTAACTSFYPTKNLGCLGDAGAVLTDDDELARQVRTLRYHGWDARFHSSASSMNSRMDEIQAAVLRAKLSYLDTWNRRRQEIAACYDSELLRVGLRPAPHQPWATPAYYIYVAASGARDALREYLEASGIGTDVHWPSLPHLQPAFADLGYVEGSFPIAERLCQEVVTLPMYPELSPREVERICRALQSLETRSLDVARVN